MSLSEKQGIFTLNIAKLIIWAFEQGYRVRLREVTRTNAQQRLYYYGIRLNVQHQKGETVYSIAQSDALKKTKTKRSAHMRHLACDMVLDIDEVYQEDWEAYRPLGEHWKSLHPNNIWGGDWKNFRDGPHLEMRQ